MLIAGRGEVVHAADIVPAEAGGKICRIVREEENKEDLKKIKQRNPDSVPTTFALKSSLLLQASYLLSPKSSPFLAHL